MDYLRLCSLAAIFFWLLGSLRQSVSGQSTPTMVGPAQWNALVRDPSLCRNMPKACSFLSLRPEQGAVFNDQRRFRAAIVKRRWGKTYLACAELGRGATNKVGDYLYLAPSPRMAEDIGWAAMRAIIPGELIEKITQSTLSLKLKNGSTIHLGDTENVDAWRGFALRGVVLDEFALYDKDVWRCVIAPSIADLRGWALFLTTARLDGSLGPCYDSIGYKLQPIYRYGSSRGKNISDGNVEEARKTLSRQAFKVEFEAAMM